MNLHKEGALVVFSGGQDSTTCLGWALKTFDPNNVYAVTFEYGQRHATEIKAAMEITEKHLKLPPNHHYVLDVGLLGRITSNALTRGNVEIEAGQDGGLPSTFVDGRNMIFLTFAAVVAKQRGLRHIVTGVSQTDFSGYPDCRDVFIRSLNATLDLAMNHQFVIHTPLMWLSKLETWEMADAYGCFDIVRRHTVTCYHGFKGTGCGECPSCLLRNKGLAEYLSQWKGSVHP